eukprot:m.120790 g.120790  ORF g.120790 m.120790 type:complete len:307 (-) comp28830_c1_seq2:144-1064(-)
MATSASSSAPKSDLWEKAWPGVRRFVAGYASGIALVAVGHPFDTIKVRLQTDTSGRFNGVVDAVKQTVKKEGIRGLYKGVGAPLAMTGAVNCVLFGTQFNIVAALERMNGLKPGEATLAMTMQAAVLSGAMIPILVTPMEGVKARLQVQYSAGAQYSGPIDCVKKVYKGLGMRGLYRGHVPVTLCRMSNYSYFGAFAFFNNLVGTYGEDKVPSRTRTLLAPVFAGSMAGVFYWLSCYPIDVIKNRIQAAPDTNPPRYRGMFHVAEEIWVTKGVRGFFVGFSACALRAMPANAAAFAGFSFAMSMLP